MGSALGATTAASVDLGVQSIEILTGQREEYDFAQTALKAGTGAVVGAYQTNAEIKKYESIAAANGEVVGTENERSYGSYNEFKKAEGAAGSGKEWHHIVEQNQVANSNIDPYKVYSTKNTIAIDKSIHTQISGYYSSKDPNLSPDVIVREWLRNRSFEEQFEFGNNILKSMGIIK